MNAERNGLGGSRTAVAALTRMIKCLRRELPLALLASAVACGPPLNEAAFERFEASTVELRNGAERALTVQYEWAQERFELSVTRGSSDTLSEALVQSLLIDQVSGDPFGWQYPSLPLFVATKSFRSGVGGVNEGVVAYASLLRELVTAGRLSVDELERRVADVNTGISDAASRLTEQAPARELAIISVAATRLLEEYVESKKRDALTKAIRQSTPTIAEVCQHMREAMKLAARHVRQEYDERSFALANQLAGAGNLSVVQRREIVREMIALNDLYVTHLETLRTLDRAYQQLPEAHQELSLRGDESRTEEIRRLYDDGRRLQELYRRAREATRKEE